MPGFKIDEKELDTLAEPSTNRVVANFNSSNYFKFTDGTYKRFASVDTTTYPYQQSIDMSKYKQNNTSVSNVAVKGTRPIFPYSYQYIVTGTSVNVSFGVSKASDGSIKVKAPGSSTWETWIPASVDAKRLIVIVQGGGGGGGGADGYYAGYSGGAGGCRIAIVPIAVGDSFTAYAGGYGAAGGYQGRGGSGGESNWGSTLVRGLGGGGAILGGHGGGGSTAQDTSATWGSFAWSGGAGLSSNSFTAYNFKYWQESGSLAIEAQSAVTGGGNSRFGRGGSRGSTGSNATTPTGYGAGGGGGGGGSFLGGNASAASRGGYGRVWIYY